MNQELLRQFFLRCALLNYFLLLLWFVLWVGFHDPFKRFLEVVCRRPIPDYDRVTFLCISFYKIAIILLNIIPWIALVMMRESQQVF